MGAFCTLYERHSGWLAIRLARRCDDRDLVGGRDAGLLRCRLAETAGPTCLACYANSPAQQNPAWFRLADRTPGGNPMASNVQTRSPSDLTGVRCGALLACRSVLLAFLLVVWAQIFLAGLGVFSVTDHGASADTALLVLGISGFLCASGRRWRSRMAGS